MRLAACLISIYFCHVFFYAPCGLPRGRLRYIYAMCSSMRYVACRAPDFHIFLPKNVLFYAPRGLAARQTSINFCHVLFYAPRGLPRARLPYISAKCSFMCHINAAYSSFLVLCRWIFVLSSNSYRLKNQEFPVAAKLFSLMRTLSASGFLQDL
jgi:hypothetical protein